MYTTAQIERQLKIRIKYYKATNWGGYQTNEKDARTNFIYKIFEFKNLLIHIRDSKLESSLIPYAINRWYNYWSAKGIEQILVEANDNIIPEKNVKCKYQDFFINGIPFDHKTTIFPKGFGKSYEYARQHPQELLEWLYYNQSPNTYRNSTKYANGQNRVYLVLYNPNGEHWKLRAELTKIRTLLANRSDDYIVNGQIYKLFWFTDMPN